MNINCVIIEDQLPAQRVLKTYINDVPELNLVGTYTNALDASSTLHESKIDLVFLDINLPKMSGISFLKNLKSDVKVIITTAYPDYALEGFELDVVDYLLKPFSFERFHKSVLKVLEQTNSKEMDADYIFVKSDKEFHKLEISSILYLKSDGNFVKIITSDNTHFLAGSLQNWIRDLPSTFVRVHKSYIVNLGEVKKVSGNRIRIRDEWIPIGRSHRESLFKKISR